VASGADPAEAAVLEHAASMTVHAADPVVGAGRYLVVHTTSVTTINGGLADGTVGDHQSRQSDTLYMNRPGFRSVLSFWRMEL
jgi:hypothetical protein